MLSIAIIALTAAASANDDSLYGMEFLEQPVCYEFDVDALGEELVETFESPEDASDGALVLAELAALATVDSEAVVAQVSSFVEECAYQAPPNENPGVYACCAGSSSRLSFDEILERLQEEQTLVPYLGCLEDDFALEDVYVSPVDLSELTLFLQAQNEFSSQHDHMTEALRESAATECVDYSAALAAFATPAP